jgi:hypothetical protein
MNKFLAAAALGAAVVSAPVSAATTFTFTGNDPVNGSVGNAFNYSAGGVSFRVSAWRATASAGGFTYTANQSYLARFSNGLGVTSSGDQNGMNNLHTVENQNGFDFVMIQFDRNVRLTGANLDTYRVANSFDNDAMLSTGIVNAPWNSTIALHNNSALMTALVSNAVSVKNSPGTPDARTFSYNQTGNVWILGADHQNTDGVDGFKLKSITFSPAVPEPATWAMMIGGFGLVGAAARRRGNRQVSLTA